jgi:hypothetical protein
VGYIPVNTLHNISTDILYSLQNGANITKINTYVWKAEGKRQLWVSTRKSENDIKMDFKVMECGLVSSITGFLPMTGSCKPSACIALEEFLNTFSTSILLEVEFLH